MGGSLRARLGTAGLTMSVAPGTVTGMEILLALIGLALGLLVGWLVAAQRAASRVHDAELRAGAARAALEAERNLASERFTAVASEVLRQNNEQFLALAGQSLARAGQRQEAQLAQREEAVRALVEPIAKTLESVKEQVDAAERARIESHSTLAEQVAQMRQTSELLRGETSQLVTALRSAQTRGAWGEMQLRRVVEAAGMLDRVDFTEQPTVRTDDGVLRPDLVVHLAGGKNVVVDAKVPFLGYLEAQQAEQESVRAERLTAHTRHVRTHVDQLAGKAYWEQLSPAPEFVVMFVPAEAFLAAALEQDPAILEYAMSKNVLLATPTSLLALLRTVAYAWRQEALAENAQQVLTLGKELHGRLATMGSHLAKLGRAIGSAASAYNETVGSLERRVLVSARRLADLGVVDDGLDTVPPVETALSMVSAPELVASAEEHVVAIDEGPAAQTR